MLPPSADEVEKLYPLEEWSRDLDLWYSKGPLSNEYYPQLAAYYQKVQAKNPAMEENHRRMWMTLAFLQSFQPDLIKAGVIPSASPGSAALSPALVTALYRAFMSPVAGKNPRGITVPLILQVVKEQKDWNEDRT